MVGIIPHHHHHHHPHPSSSIHPHVSPRLLRPCGLRTSCAIFISSLLSPCISAIPHIAYRIYCLIFAYLYECSIRTCLPPSLAAHRASSTAVSGPPQSRARAHSLERARMDSSSVAPLHHRLPSSRGRAGPGSGPGSDRGPWDACARVPRLHVADRPGVRADPPSRPAYIVRPGRPLALYCIGRSSLQLRYLRASGLDTCGGTADAVACCWFYLTFASCSRNTGWAGVSSDSRIFLWIRLRVRVCCVTVRLAVSAACEGLSAALRYV
ncbi:hypothetical protein OH76DRAFT_480973 [Lentinus brumalis]|uniref:Uncharacterized protein n=1 Tax=Lentinus brumalis TaxID=2498619 RepID=A0A371DC26_9APHY|nr:hypothetical protein OH76DRAFT_480973 [Polyporus brumalis]